MTRELKRPPRFYRALHWFWLGLALFWLGLIAGRLVWSHSLFWQMHVSLKSAVLELAVCFIFWYLHYCSSRNWAIVLQVELAGSIIAGGLLLAEGALLKRFNGSALIRIQKTYDGSLAAYSKEAIYARLLQFDGLEIAVFTPDTVADCRVRDLRWKHFTDRRGMRNPGPIDSADILLIGDSYTYGFGLDVSQSVAAHLEKSLGLKVAVLANANSGMFPKWLQLRALIDELNPKAIVCLVCHNDPLDDWEDAGKSWAERASAWTNDSSAPQPKILPKPPEDQLRRMIQLPLLRSLISPGASQLAGLMKVLLRGRQMDQRFSPNPPYWPMLAAQTKAMPSDDHPGWAVTFGSLERMRNLADSRRFPLATLPIMPPRLGPNVGMAELFEKRAKELKLPVISTRELTDHPSYFLPTDGHFSLEGNRVVSGWIAEWYKSTVSK